MGTTARGEDWHDICQAIDKGVEGPKCEATHYQYKELQKARHLTSKTPEGRSATFRV